VSSDENHHARAGQALPISPATRGMPTAPDHVLVDIVEEVYLPLVRGRGVHPSGPDSTARPSFPAK
jgi:hypothetical protein